MRRTLQVAAGLVCGVVALAGCTSPDLSDLPGPDAVAGATYPISAEFGDALNLPQGAKVRTQGAVIGEVTGISTRDYRAYVTMQISSKVQLRAGTTAQIRFTTPLGEDYIALYPPAQPSAATIRPGTMLPLRQTSQAPTIEDAFAALSLLLNGGGIDQVGTIVHELDKTLSGRTGTIRTVIEQLDRFAGALNARSADIGRALDALHTLTARLRSGDGVIADALEQFPPALRVLASQTRNITELIEHVGALGDVTADVLDRSTQNLLADLDEVRPTLSSLVRVRSQFAPTLRLLTQLGGNLDAATPGDYVNADGLLTLIFDDRVLRPANSSGNTRTTAASAGAGSSAAGSAGAEASSVGPAASGAEAVRHLLVGSIAASPGGSR